MTENFWLLTQSMYNKAETLTNLSNLHLLFNKSLESHWIILLIWQTVAKLLTLYFHNRTVTAADKSFNTSIFKTMFDHMATKIFVPLIPQDWGVNRLIRVTQKLENGSQISLITATTGAAARIQFSLHKRKET